MNKFYAKTKNTEHKMKTPEWNKTKKMQSIFDEDVVRMMGIMMFGIGFIESTLRWLKFCKIFLHTYLERKSMYLIVGVI